MSHPPDDSLTARTRRSAIALALFALLGAVTTLSGWALEIPRLTDWEGDGVSQQPNNALGVAAAGAALLCWVLGRTAPARALASFAGLIGAATIFEHLGGVDLGIDQLLVRREWGQRGTVVPGRMGIPGSLSLTVIGTAITMGTFRRTRSWAAAGGLTAIGVAMLSQTGYLFRADPLYAIPRLTTIALQSSLMIMALGLGTVCAVHDREPMRTILGHSAGAVLLRRGLPFVILLPVAAGWLSLLGQEAGLFDAPFATALFVLLLIAVLSFLLWRSVQIVAAQESALRESRDQLAVSLAAVRESEKTLLAADRMKDEFLATLSHELRTPLTSIVGWSQILLNSDLDRHEQRAALEAIGSSARMQAQLTEEVLDVSRIITGKMRLDRRMTDLPPVIEAAVDTVRPAAEAKGISLRLSLDRTLPRHYVDANRIRQVMWNLLSNAIKFSPAGSTVDVELRADASHSIVEVRDRGQGITHDFLPHVFQRFRQADGSSAREHGGLGIGLALARDLVELHGGTIGVESVEGQGSIFSVRLPLPERVGEDAAHPPPVEPLDRVSS